MGTTITLELPEHTAVQLAQTAHTQQTTIAAIVQTLLDEQSSRLPAEVESELEALHYLATDLLYLVAQTSLPPSTQERLAELAYQQQNRGLTTTEQAEQTQLLDQYDRIMVRRTTAIDLLRQRGEAWQIIV
jgi:hypothetical protein